jgi:hypothetical protein
LLDQGAFGLLDCGVCFVVSWDNYRDRGVGGVPRDDDFVI